MPTSQVHVLLTHRPADLTADQLCTFLEASLVLKLGTHAAFERAIHVYVTMPDREVNLHARIAWASNRKSVGPAATKQLLVDAQQLLSTTGIENTVPFHSAADLLYVFAGLPLRDRGELAPLRAALFRKLIAAASADQNVLPTDRRSTHPAVSATAAARALHALARLRSADAASSAALASALLADAHTLDPADAASALWALARLPK